MVSNKYKKLFNDAILFAIGIFGSRVLLFLLIPLYTNVLTSSEYGIADLVFTVSDLLQPFVSLAIYNGLLRFGLIDNKREDAIRCASVVFVFGSFLIFLLTPVIGFYKPIYEWRWYLVVKIIVSFAQTNVLICLKIKDKNKLYAISSILQALMLVLCNVLFLVFMKLGIKGYLLSSIFSSGFTSVFAFIIGGIFNDLRMSHRNCLLLKQMIMYSIPFIGNDVSWWLIHSSGIIMIEWYIGSSFLGLYTAASKIPSLINALSAIFVQAWGIASIKEFDSTNDSEFYSNTFKYFIICIFGACIFFISITKPFMSFYVGEAFVDSWHYVPLLLVSATFAAISSFIGSLFGAVKRSGKLMTTTLISAGVNLLFNYFFIQICGIWGAVIGTVSSYLVIMVLRLIMLRDYLKFNYNYVLLSTLSLLVAVEALLVGLDIYLESVAIISIMCYIFLVGKDIKALVNKAIVCFSKHIDNK